MDALLFTPLLGVQAWLWLMFLGIVVVLLVLDLGVLHRKEHEIGIRESLILSAGYIAVALTFGAWIWHSRGAEDGLAWVTGYMVEKTLSLDNVFVISLIFTSLAVPRIYQHRVLFWGILGVIVLRGLMIGFGTALVSQFSWVLYLFGAFLVITGVKMLFAKDSHDDPTQGPVMAWLRRVLRVTPELHGNRFFVRDGGAWRATPLFLALAMVELADLVFAVDSVPAIFAISTDPYIVYTSNIFAVLGLRALYFALAAMVHRFATMKLSLSLILVFIGGKIFWTHLVGKPDPAVTLGVTFALIAAGVGLSLWRTRRQDETA
ncbi:MAG: TerC family protein [Magnetospirillum gryphiswaldense]|nr:TerC family protein [Magnetospirillum gryphiswaldense]